MERLTWRMYTNPRNILLGGNTTANIHAALVRLAELEDKIEAGTLVEVSALVMREDYAAKVAIAENETLRTTVVALKLMIQDRDCEIARPKELEKKK